MKLSTRTTFINFMNESLIRWNAVMQQNWDDENMQQWNEKRKFHVIVWEWGKGRASVMLKNIGSCLRNDHEYIIDHQHFFFCGKFRFFFFDPNIFNRLMNIIVLIIECQLIGREKNASSWHFFVCFAFVVFCFVSIHFFIRGRNANMSGCVSASDKNFLQTQHT